MNVSLRLRDFGPPACDPFTIKLHEMDHRAIFRSSFGHNARIHQGDVIHHHGRTSTDSCHLIPFPRNEDVVHRGEPFAKLDELLPPSHQYQSAALWGLGGSGKTQIALDYAYRRCDDPGCSVFWVHADSETTFVQGYRMIARKLLLDDGLAESELLAAVRDTITSRSRWLLVLDNADNLPLFGVNQDPRTSGSLLRYIPHGPGGTILWTSRDERIVGSLVSPRRGIQVARMRIEEALSLLEIATNKKIPPKELEDAESLLWELQCLPLAIYQAGAYMRRTSQTVLSYSTSLAEQGNRWRIMNEKEFDRHRRPDVPNSMVDVWTTSMELIKYESETAHNILHTLAYFENDNIPAELVAAAAAAAAAATRTKRQEGRPCRQDEDVKMAIIRLKEFSFLIVRQQDSSEESYEMHKLVQEVVRYGHQKTTVGRRPESQETEPERFYFDAALQGIASIFPDSSRETWACCEKLVTHAVRLSEWSEVFAAGLQLADLLSRISAYLYDRARWPQKEIVDKRTLDIRMRILGERHPDTITTMGELSLTYKRLGRGEEDREMTRKVLELRLEVLGEKHVDTLWAMRAMAYKFADEARYNQAEEMFSKVLELQKQTLGEANKETIQTMGGIATLQHLQGRINEAEGTLTNILDSQRQASPGNNPDTLYFMDFLANIYVLQGRYNDAESLFLKVSGLRTEVLGDDHPDTWATWGSLGVTFYWQGRYKEAETTIGRALKEFKKGLSGQAGVVATLMGSLAATYREQGRYDEAEEIFASALDNECPNRAIHMGALGALYHAQGRYKESEEILIKALSLQREVNGGVARAKARNMRFLADAYLAQGRYQESEDICNESLELQRKFMGEGHPDFATNMGSLAATYRAQGRYSEAEGTYTKALRLQQKTLGEWHPNALSSMHGLAITFRMLGQDNEAASIMEDCLKRRRESLGPGHPLTKQSTGLLDLWRSTV